MISENHKKAIVSLERFNDSFNYHLIIDKGSIITTAQVKNIVTKEDYERLFIAILNNDFEEIVNFFVEKHPQLQHEHLTFSYGAMLRNYIKEKREEYNKIKQIYNPRLNRY